LAQAFALCDAERGLKYAPPPTKMRERRQCLANMAGVAARYDLDKAMELLDMTRDRERSLKSALVPMTYNAAWRSPKDGIEIVERYGKDCAPFYFCQIAPEKAEALGWVAVAIADREPAKAWSLIDQALDICVHTVDPWHRSGWDSDGNRPARAAVLALQAKRIGYPDMQSIYHRVLASRMAAGTDFSSGDAVRENIKLVILLSLINPDLARDLLEIMQSRLDRTNSRLPWTHGAMAWALVGDDRLPELVRQRVARAEGLQAWDLALLEISEVVNVLTSAPSHRAERMMRNRGRIWVPGK
jgi:hypothetical protein